MKPIHAILIQFGIIIILVLIGFACRLDKIFEKDDNFTFSFFGIFMGIAYLLCIIFLICFYCGNFSFESKFWFIYHIYFIIMVIVYCFCFSNGIDFKTIFTLLLELLFGLIAVLLLKGKRI